MTVENAQVTSSGIIRFQFSQIIKLHKKSVLGMIKVFHLKCVAIVTKSIY